MGFLLGSVGYHLFANCALMVRRIFATVGYGAPLDFDAVLVTVHLNEVLVAEKGGCAATYSETNGARTLKNEDITVAINLGRGAAIPTCPTSSI